MGKNKQSSDSSSSDSDSNSDSDASSRENEKNRRKEASSSDGSNDQETTENKPKHKHNKEEHYDKAKKPKYDDMQKSKWDSPSENIAKHKDRKFDKDANYRRYSSNRDDGKDSRRYYDKSRNDKRDTYRYKSSRDDDRKYKEDRYNHNQNRERYNRRQNGNQYRSDRRRSRSRDDKRRDKRDDSRNRLNKKPKMENDESESYVWGKRKNEEEKKPPANKEKPDFGLSGKLTEDTNTYRGVVIKYSEPSEARKPKRRWRLYPFKGEKALPTLYIHRESAYLMGRDRKVVDFPLDHPSCSKQHAVLQYRLVPFTRDNGSVGKRVRPYLIDLDSANGTYINNKKIEPRKYVELLEKDVIKFGYSTREYVLLHENSKDEALDDDVKQEDEEQPIKEERQE